MDGETVAVIDYESLLSAASHKHQNDNFTITQVQEIAISVRGLETEDAGTRRAVVSPRKRAEQDALNLVAEERSSAEARHLPENIVPLPVKDVANNAWTSEAKSKSFQLTAQVMTCLGASGPGLLAVRGIPAVDVLRRQLLPLAKKLALMPDITRRAAVLKEQGLSTDVPMKNPNRSVSAFATQLRYGRHHTDDGLGFKNSSPSCVVDVLQPTSNDKANDGDFAQLGNVLRQLGVCMVEVGLLIARICDSAIPSAGLEDLMWESGSAKARLIHYHAYDEKYLLSSSMIGSQGFKRKSVSTKQQLDDRPKPSMLNPLSTSPPEELWQQWHYDYGIFTVLTAPMFLSPSSSSSQDLYPGGHTGLRFLSMALDGFVRVPPDCLLVQVGEAAQIASGGKLAATAHCVTRPGQRDMSRETFVTFLQPSWQRVLSPPLGMTREEVLHPRPVNKFSTATKGDGHLALVRANLECTDCEERRAELQPDLEGLVKDTRSWSQGEEKFVAKGCSAERASDYLTCEYKKLLRVVPTLASRWRDGCTFAEFSKETTSQYYGAHGHQPQNRS